ncbi:hypothetical protein GQX73_g2249 [Xylaria multiplex]|uniref:DUF8035 domain-containing protein n=1 Tax=Xylaria multiplex TaxID=323545 RepID=A0A7C8IVE6_9PEZI|nr:hypothetical protein GQX73_g2249 [Xylaria multiplex]
MAYRSSRTELSERDYAHRRAPVRDYDDDLSDRVDRTPAFLREDRRGEAGPLVLRSREVETVDRRRPRSPSPQVRYRERIVDRERVPSPLPDRRPVRFVERSPSPPPPRVQIVDRVERRTRERSPTPDRERELIRLRIERERQRERTPSPSPSPSPPPPQVIRMVRVKPPTPPPAPTPRRAQSRTRERETDIDIDISHNETDIDIRRRTRSRSRPREQSRPRARPRPQHRPSYDDDDIIIINKDKLKVAETRRRAHSAAPRPEWDEEAEYITGKIDARGRFGEAWNGATKDWTIVDVPPGTERVKMDGVGGGGAEVTWQRYNGVRRSKFIPESNESPVALLPEPVRDSSRERERLSVQIYDSKRPEREVEVEEVRDRRISIRDGERVPSKKRDEMWTEITKDLVNREAIERMGYAYEETEWFFYVMQYLRYEDILELIDLTKDIRRARRHRAREIEEHDHYTFSRRHHGHRHLPWDRADDERVVEREVVYDSGSRYYR